MIAVAQLLFADARSQDDLLLALERHLASATSFRVSRTEWRGYSIIIPQVLVGTSPVVLTLQVDRAPEYVPAEIAELAEHLSGKANDDELNALRQCDTRVDIMSASSAQTSESEDAITVFASSDLDPTAPDVTTVLNELQSFTGAWVVDNMDGRIRKPGSAEWIVLFEA